MFKGKRSYNVAADITLIAYHGQPWAEESEVLRAQAKCGTNHFHGYATLSIVPHGQRYVLALRFVRLHERTDRVQRLGTRVRRIFLDYA